MEYLEIVQLVSGEICNLYCVWSSSSALHLRIVVQLYRRAWIHSLQFVWLPKRKEFLAVVPASQFLSLPLYASYGLRYIFWMRVALLFCCFLNFSSASHSFIVMLFSKQNNSQNDMLQNCSLPS